MTQLFAFRQSISLTSRCCSRVPRAVTGVRLFSSADAIDKVKRVFEEYRKENYTQETPSRFKKELICAIDRNHNGFVTLDDIDQLLVNIGAAGRVSRQDLEYALSELGMKRTSAVYQKTPPLMNRMDVIPVETVQRLF